MGLVDYFQIGFLIVVVIVGIGGFLWAVNKDEE